ncbi:MAG: hypothetical protein AAF591_03600 [Verrucomicrobiota bacterium]
MNDLIQLGVTCMFGAATKEEIESWINTNAASDGEVDPDIFEIFSRDVRTSRSRLEQYFRKRRPEFKIDSDEGVQACKRVLKQQIGRLHSKEITPYTFCRFICELEAYYMDNASKIDGKIPYPDFLGDLWNACDWCDESWTLDSAGHLRDESARVAETLTKA